jgi:hypothetical protein
VPFEASVDETNGTSLRLETRSWTKWAAAHRLHYDGFSLKLVPFVDETGARWRTKQLSSGGRAVSRGFTRNRNCGRRLLERLVRPVRSDTRRLRLSPTPPNFVPEHRLPLQGNRTPPRNRPRRSQARLPYRCPRIHLPRLPADHEHRTRLRLPRKPSEGLDECRGRAVRRPKIAPRS